MSHSKGPWRIEVYDGERNVICADGQSLMSDREFYPHAPANEADWKLIAAAPQLLEALKLALAECYETEAIGGGYESPWMKQARAAIQAAGGGGGVEG